MVEQIPAYKAVMADVRAGRVALNEALMLADDCAYAAVIDAAESKPSAAVMSAASALLSALK